MTKTFVKIGSKLYDTAEWDLPSHGIAFRDAWQAGDGVITVNLEKAKEIWRAKLRYHRMAVLDELDSKFIVALERGESTAAIVAKKQLLRDAPNDPRIDAATNLEELKKLKPDWVQEDF